MRRRPTRRPGARRRRPALCALALALLLPAAAWPAGSFYLNLLRDGERAYQRGEFSGAARDLRIASFGLLDEPDLLTQALVMLALAQAGAGDGDGFQQTFDRLLVVEQRFEVYRNAAIATGLRAAFEAEAARRVSAGTLRSSPAFEHLAPAAATAAPGASAGARRRQLEAGLVAEPGDIALLLQLAELEFAEGRARRAAAHLDELLAVDPQNGAARCLRGRVAARARDCRRAVAELVACGETSDRALTRERLSCLVRLKQWPQADELLVALPGEVRQDAEIARLEQRVRRALPSPPPAPVVAGTGQAAFADPPADPGAALADLERRLGEARTADQLALLLADARRLVGEHSESRRVHFVAAEIAYRASSWSDVVAFLQQAGGPPPEDGALQFYLAVSLYETGRPQAAAEPMRRALAAIERTPFVDSYALKILGADAGAS